jgi:hypothetical protein
MGCGSYFGWLATWLAGWLAAGWLAGWLAEPLLAGDRATWEREIERTEDGRGMGDSGVGFCMFFVFKR